MMVYQENRAESIFQIPHYRSWSTALIQNDNPLNGMLLYQLLDGFYLAWRVYIGPLG
jgi:hypothetical protein